MTSKQKARYLESQRERRKARKERGLCRYCDQKTNGRWLCESCRREVDAREWEARTQRDARLLKVRVYRRVDSVDRMMALIDVILRKTA
jgi:hypothetical protein